MKTEAKHKLAVIEIFGASDDLIEIRGSLGDDEFGAYDAGKHLIFSDGSILFVKYIEGVWRVKPVKIAEGSTFKNVEAPADNEDNYSDRATLSGNITSVKCRASIKPTKDELMEMLEDFDPRDYSVEQLTKIVEILDK